MPNKKLILLSLVVSLIVPFHYLVFYTSPPNGYIFSGGYEDNGVQLWLMKSVEYGFDDAWSMGNEKTYQNPAQSSAFVYIPLL